MDTIKIKPIKLDEWLPDRCLTGIEPFNPKFHPPEAGCPSLNYFQKNDKASLIQLYKLTIKKYGGCGFVAWENDSIVAYHNFFPADIAGQIRFYGYGSDSLRSDKTLIHNCLSMVRGNYIRKGIASRLVKESVKWAKENDWKRFEVHLVLPDCEQGWQSDQKSCLSFWQRFGFKIFREYSTDEGTMEYYGVTKRYSLCLRLDGQ